MLYGYNTSPRTTYVVAAHESKDLKSWFDKLMAETGTPLYSEQRTVEMFEYLMEDSFDGLKTEIYEFKFAHDHNQAEFARIHDIVILPRINAIDRNQDMHFRDNDTFYTDTRTIGEITGTDVGDPYDTTSDEDKAQAKALKDMMKQRQKDDEVSNDDSFSNPQADKGGVVVTDINASLDGDGKVVVEGVNAVKLTGNEIEESQKEMKQVQQQTKPPAQGRNPVLDQAVIVDIDTMFDKKPKSRKKKE
jgi:hypothetical protein